MKQIIEEVIQTEEKVNAMLKQARMEASEISHNAEREIAEQLGKAKEQAQEIMKATLEQGRQEAECMRDERLKQTDLEKETLINTHAQVITGLVDQICNIILATAYDD